MVLTTCNGVACYWVKRKASVAYVYNVAPVNFIYALETSGLRILGSYLHNDECLVNNLGSLAVIKVNDTEMTSCQNKKNECMVGTITVCQYSRMKWRYMYKVGEFTRIKCLE